MTAIVLVRVEKKCVCSRGSQFVCLCVSDVEGVFPWQPDWGQHVTLFHSLSVLPYANEAGASLQTLALMSIYIISTFAGGKKGQRRDRKQRERICVWKNQKYEKWERWPRLLSSPCQNKCDWMFFNRAEFIQLTCHGLCEKEQYFYFNYFFIDSTWTLVLKK